ncbi:MAG: dihydroorotase [Fibrobacterales bacterium]
MEITKNSITLIKPDDLHLHIRQGEPLINYVNETARQFKRAVIMPNTLPPIITPEGLEEYRSFILEHTDGFEPLMTFKLIPGMEISAIADFKECNVIAGKYYPAGATTNAEDGATNIKQLYPLFEEMERLDMVLSIHGEDPNVLCIDREEAFLPSLQDLVDTFPKLRIVLEHVSSAAAIKKVQELPDTVVATITVHHLFITLDDVIKNPHNLCMPIAKRASDRDAIASAALSGNNKFFFGSDSAPHPKTSKECSSISAGVYTAPAALPLLVEFFDQNDALDLLENFCSVFGAQYYGIPQNSETITLKKTLHKIPEICYGVVPFMAGETVRWKIDD